MYEGKPRPGPPAPLARPQRGRERGAGGPRPAARPRFAAPPGDVSGRRRGTPALPGARRERGEERVALVSARPRPRGPGRSVPGGGRWVKSVPVPSRTMRWTELALRLRVCCVCMRVCACCLPAPRRSSLSQDRLPRSVPRFPRSSPRRSSSPPGRGDSTGSGDEGQGCWSLLSAPLASPSAQPGLRREAQVPQLSFFRAKKITVFLYI